MTKKFRSKGPKRTIIPEQCTVELDRPVPKETGRKLLKMDGSVVDAPLTDKEMKEHKKAQDEKGKTVNRKPRFCLPTYCIGSDGPDPENPLAFEMLLQKARELPGDDEEEEEEVEETENDQEKTDS